MIANIKRLFVAALLGAFTFVGFTQTVQAAMIGTEQIHAAANASQDRARVAAALERPDVVRQLETMGVSPSDAKARVAALSDEEVATLAGKVDSLPAGGDVLGVLLFVFVLLLVTDILGLTKVYPFTRSHR
jgi:TolA-binding protein